MAEHTSGNEAGNDDARAASTLLTRVMSALTALISADGFEASFELPSGVVPFIQHHGFSTRNNVQATLQIATSKGDTTVSFICGRLESPMRELDMDMAWMVRYLRGGAGLPLETDDEFIRFFAGRIQWRLNRSCRAPIHERLPMAQTTSVVILQ